jgi:hypothetical protein
MTAVNVYFVFREPHIKFQLLFVLAIAIGHFLDGTVLAYPSPAIPSLSNTTEFDVQHMSFVSEFQMCQMCFLFIIQKGFLFVYVN